MTNAERIYYILQENDCVHWFRDNADTLQLAEYLDKKGCIAPPLKMGDKVWIIDWCNEINGYEVTHIRYNKDLNGERYSYDAIMFGKNGADIGFFDSDIGKYVFLTKEEALQRKEDEKNGLLDK